MDVVRVGLIYMLVGLMAGGIAYLGNQLGRQIGRRKMSVLNLRPRHTSILITSLTGALIALVTLTMFAFLSEPVRALLTGLEQLRREESRLQDQITALRQALEEGSIVWRVDEPIAHITIEPFRTPDQVRASILGMLAEVNARTLRHNNEIARQKGEEQLPLDQVLVDHEPRQLERLSARLAMQPVSQGVKVTSEKNCLYRDRAPVRLDSWEVRRVFREDEEVARRRVDPEDPVQMLSQFYEFLEATRAAALSRGMRPVGGEWGGGLTDRQFDDLLAKMRSQSGPLDLVALANRDLYETSSLDVRIDVRPVDLTGAAR